jgi:hypothetical protein
LSIARIAAPDFAGYKKCFRLREKQKLFNAAGEDYLADLRSGDDSMALSFDERTSE